ncbi:hypothetical protein BDW59DRAFT_156478 [Aspergillus cavernicola]|uniref:Uncharacterized protein n=1 Tax=Aspergillus cavernicola TaxID=176166 RepID=A0ABR4J0W7_9EURO
MRVPLCLLTYIAFLAQAQSQSLVPSPFPSPSPSPSPSSSSSSSFQYLPSSSFQSPSPSPSSSSFQYLPSSSFQFPSLSPSPSLSLFPYPSPSSSLIQPYPSPSSIPTPPCTILSRVTHTFYGFSNNDDQSDIVYDCGRGRTAGGIGTYDDPLTFASSPAEFQRCETIYDPYLHKYLRHEDYYCAECNYEWLDQIYRVQVWMGGTQALNGGDEQDCMERLTPLARTQSLIRNPGMDLVVDFTPLYVAGSNRSSACNVNHVYPSYAPGNYCSGNNMG